MTVPAWATRLEWEEFHRCAATGYNFTTVPLSFIEIYPAVETRSVDFIFANPSFYACLEREFGVTASATLINSREGVALSQFGGVLFTLVRRNAARFS